MKRMAACIVLGIVAWGLIQDHNLAQEKPGEVTLKVVKYDGLAEEVVKNRGKVVLVDFWADTCAPCKKAFPHTVELHKKLASKGLVVISVSLDSLDEESAEVKARALAFLKKKDATFTNLLLDEPAGVWQKRLRSATVPLIYVFSRTGKWTQFTGGDLATKSDEIDRLVEELLAEK